MTAKNETAEGASSDTPRAYDEIRNQPLVDLPAWAFEELLRRTRKTRSLKQRALLSVFPNESQLVEVFRDFPGYQHLLVQQALQAAFAQWEIHILDHDRDGGVLTVPYRFVAIGTEEEALACIEATYVLHSPDGQRIVAHVEVTDQPPFGGHGNERSLLALICLAPMRALVAEKLREIASWIKANNFLRGKKLTASGGFIQLKRKYGWDDVFADPTLISMIRRNTEAFLARLDRDRQFGLPTKRGVILVGPPGTGKSLIGKVLCSQTKETFIAVTPGDVQGSDAIGEVFEMARALVPTLLFVEDLDLIGARRGRDIYANMLLGQLMNQMDGLKENDALVVVATTNDLDAIEPALRDRPSRFDCLIEIPDVTDEIRQRYLRAFLSKRSIGDHLYPDIEQATRRCRTIAEVQEQAIRYLQGAVENDVDLSAVTSPLGLPRLEGVEAAQSERGGIGFRASRG
jgi:hypothetical protein